MQVLNLDLQDLQVFTLAYELCSLSRTAEAGKARTETDGEETDALHQDGRPGE